MTRYFVLITEHVCIDSRNFCYTYKFTPNSQLIILLIILKFVIVGIQFSVTATIFILLI
jgi:hypothetical protein